MNSIQTNYNYSSGFSNICWTNLRFLSAKTDFCLFRKYNLMNEGIAKVQRGCNNNFQPDTIVTIHNKAGLSFFRKKRFLLCSTKWCSKIFEE